MKTMFIKPSAIRRFVKERNKRVSSEAIESIDRVLLRVLIKSINLTRNFKTLTNKEVLVVGEMFLKD